MVGQSQTRTRPRPVVRPVDVAGVHDAAQPQHPLDAHIELVDEDEQPAARCEDACDLGGCGRLVEPVPGLGDGDEVEGRRFRTGVLGSADPLRCLIASKRRGIGIDGQHLASSCEQLPTEDPGSGSEVAHPLPLPVRAGQIECGRGITGTDLVVDLGLSAEAAPVR